MSHPPSPPPFPPQQPPPYPSAIKFTVQGSVMSSNLVAPSLTIDGHRAPATTSGSTVIPVPPGHHRLEAHSQWMRQYGQASLDVAVPPNAMVEVFYAPPYHQFTTGAMGLTQQPRKGLAALVIILAVLLLLVLFVVVLALLGLG